ncbi:fluoride efflux transporter CrcB [Gallaecimonas mangrovi]|uniref:fluoride efflux transporter CrcB n=1 Tax=Gallaecimonas mangrovi TaxID=2291597 RepID=UPI000E200435|nr:fluoride efflux transporter CrcB [Gallaecimonas mangrovi]
MFQSILAIAIGATLGATARWSLGLALNSVFPTLPLGTLVANYLGAYLMGLAMAFFAVFTTVQPEWRLLAMTGFLGSLTTFSTFSAETVTLLRDGQWQWGMASIGLHVLGSLLMTTLGLFTFSLFKNH